MSGMKNWFFHIPRKDGVTTSALITGIFYCIVISLSDSITFGHLLPKKQRHGINWKVTRSDAFWYFCLNIPSPIDPSWDHRKTRERKRNTSFEKNWFLVYFVLLWPVIVHSEIGDRKNFRETNYYTRTSYWSRL